MQFWNRFDCLCGKVIAMRRFCMGNCVKRCMLGLLGILSAGATLAGCSREVVQTNDSLHVYAGGSDVIMDYAVREFERRYPDIPVEYEGRKFIEDAEEFYGYNQQLSAQLMSGAGADVFFIQDYWDIDKLVQAGAFADLSGIYDSCEVFQDEDLRGDIMDAGVFDGKRYFLPMEYRIPTMISTREILDEAGFDMEKCTDFDSFVAESGRYMNSADYDRRLFRMDLSAMNCIFWSGYPIVDRGEVVWDIEETRNYFAWYKDVYERGTGEYMFGDLFGAAAVRDGECVFESSGFLDTDLNAVRALYTVGTPVVVPIYNKDGGINVLMTRAVAVRANSENLDNVRKFLEILFDKQIMEQPGALRDDISVRKSVMEDAYESYLREAPFRVAVNGFPLELPPLKKEDYDAYLAFVDKVDNVVYWPEWRQDFQREIRRYLRGEVSYDEAARCAKEKLEFYLSE